MTHPLAHTIWLGEASNSDDERWCYCVSGRVESGRIVHVHRAVDLVLACAADLPELQRAARTEAMHELFDALLGHVICAP